MSVQGFFNRLVECFGTDKKKKIAELSGFPYSTINSYSSGSIPGLDKAEILAARAGVNFLWLALGEGPMRPNENKEIVTKKGLAERLEELQKDYPNMEITVKVNLEREKQAAA